MSTGNSLLVVQSAEEPFTTRLASGRHADPLDDNYYIPYPVSNEVLAAIQAENPDVHHAEFPENRMVIIAFTQDESRHFYHCTRCLGPMKRSWWSVFFWIVAFGVFVVFPILYISGIIPYVKDDLVGPILGVFTGFAVIFDAMMVLVMFINAWLYCFQLCSARLGAGRVPRRRFGHSMLGLTCTRCNYRPVTLHLLKALCYCCSGAAVLLSQPTSPFALSDPQRPPLMTYNAPLVLLLLDNF
ncbi:hypothetical protein AAVH_15871 [Aphelenchoides avenae]|nr:hypothetical protein AAVH_15871 [Aphelenchus avenae]